MTDLNTITVIGNLVKDGDTRVSSSGTYFSYFTVACNEKQKGGEVATFIPCVLWGKLAEVIGNSLRKGVKVAVSGRLTQNNWEKDGVKHNQLQIKVENLQILRRENLAAATKPQNNDPIDFDY